MERRNKLHFYFRFSKVIIYGKSWGGFNGLQIAYLQPKVVKIFIFIFHINI